MLYVVCDYDLVVGVFTDKQQIAEYWLSYKKDNSVLVYKPNKDYADKEAEEYTSVHTIYKETL